MKTLLALIVTSTLLVACSRDATVYPSLARRSVEAVDLAGPPASAEPVVQADAALDARIAGFGTRLGQAGRDFDGDAARTGRLAARPAARSVGSDAWLDAQTALAALDDRRAQTTALATEVEAAGSARAAALAPPYPALEALERAVAAELARQDAAIERLQAALPAA